MTDYDLKAVNLPRLTGGALRLFTELADNPATSPLLMGNLMETGGLTKLRTLKVDEPPTFSPLAYAAGMESGSPPDLETLARTPSPANGFAFAAVRDYADAYRSGRVTPGDAARRVLDAIKDGESRTPPMRLFIAVNADDVVAHFANALKQVDVIVTPTTAITAPPIRGDVLPGGESDLSVVTEAMRFIIPGNFTGLPAISFPAGYDSHGLPIGFQVMGKHWREHTLLRIARAAETSIVRKAPQVHYKILDS